MIVIVQYGPSQKQRTHGKKPILKSCDDPEVAAAAAYGPKQVRVFGCACFQQSAVRCHVFGRHQIVASQPMFAAELAEPTPERQSRDPRAAVNPPAPPKPTH